MRKVIAAINVTLDGFCDHTAIIPDDEMHNHYTELIKSGGTILYGRITYQLMEFWKPFVEKPSGNKSMDEFAIAIDNISKIVFSHTIKDVNWGNTRLAKSDLKEEIFELRQHPDKDILIGSRSLIMECLNLKLIDELQLFVHPVIIGKGLPLFQNINGRINLKLIRTKTFGGGAVILYYEPSEK
jgi:dihydrofolate reductase